MIQAAWRLGGLQQYQHLGLRRWAHMLGFRGHFLTKSRRYSTTFTALRQQRRTWRLVEDLTQLGHHTDGMNDIPPHAIAERQSQHRQMRRIGGPS
jgi:hypothetical protein